MAKLWEYTNYSSNYSALFFKEVCRFLLQEGIPFVFPERFCQDDLENYFGEQRVTSHRSDIPTVHDFGYNDNTVKIQFLIRPIWGNAQGPAEIFNEICNEPLPKRRKWEVAWKSHCCIGSWTSQELLTLIIIQRTIFMATSIVIDYWLKTLVKRPIFIATHCRKDSLLAGDIF